MTTFMKSFKISKINSINIRPVATEVLGIDVSVTVTIAPTEHVTIDGITLTRPRRLERIVVQSGSVLDDYIITQKDTTDPAGHKITLRRRDSTALNFIDISTDSEFIIYELYISESTKP